MTGSVQAINIVFDGPPSHQSGRFVEVETDDGHSINIGEWLQRPDGADHPWTHEIGTGRWGGKSDKVRLTKVDPTVVIEASADAALQAGRWRLMRPAFSGQLFDG